MRSKTYSEQASRVLKLVVRPSFVRRKRESLSTEWICRVYCAHPQRGLSSSRSTHKRVRGYRRIFAQCPNTVIIYGRYLSSYSFLQAGLPLLQFPFLHVFAT